LDLGKKYKFKKVVPTVAQLSSSPAHKNPSERIVPIKMFDFLSLRGTYRSFVKPICLIDATAFDFSSRGLRDWFATLAMIDDKIKYLPNKLAFYDNIFNFNLNIFSC
jgi:hypothetical protein